MSSFLENEPDLFSESLINENIQSGYSLDFFQILNWGVFDRSIYTLSASNKSALLTGQNGSGKTTLVDAIVTLLVPQQMRFYNQSSGSTKKKDRSEESYVRGAYGSRQAEDNISGKTQYLRGTDTISILNGVFYNRELQSYVSLLQVRYFSGDELQKIFAVTRQRLSVESIYEALSVNGLAIDRNGKWKKIITNSFGTMFFGDNFKKYSETYSQIFGFRSDKALKLFSQIVGLKVLGNLTEFIRQNMLEETQTEEEFQKLSDNYTKLIQCDNEIQKTKVQIELLEKVVDAGHRLNKNIKEKTETENFQQTLPAWKARNAISLLEKDEKRLEKIIGEENTKITLNKKKIDDCQSEIEILNANLLNNDTARQIQQLDGDIKNLTEEKNRTENNFKNYEERAGLCGLEIPRTENQFNKNKEKLSVLQKGFEQQKKQKENEKFDVQTLINESRADKEKIEKELKSLGERNSNIPLENIEIRKNIAKAVKCGENEIPFAGELIQVKKDEEDWNFAIEKLLHNFALTVLVPENLYKKVTEYARKNNVGGRLVYLRTQEEIVLSESSVKSNYVPGKIEIKNNHPLAQWLKNHIERNFSYLCTDNIEEIAKNDRVLTSSALIKNGLRHEKDDRKKIRENFIQVLGWDNSQKRRTLSAKLDELLKTLEVQTEKLSLIEENLKKTENQIYFCERLQEISLWEHIDFESLAKKIDSLSAERNRLASSKDIKEVQQKLDSKKDEKFQLDNQRDELNKSLGRHQDSHEKIVSEKKQNEKIWALYSKDSKMLEKTDAQIEKLNLKFNIKEDFAESGELNEKSREISEILKENLKKLQNQNEELNAKLVNSMSAVKNPKKEYKEKFGDWSAEFSDFDISSAYFNDYENRYNHLSQDDLPKYQSQFHKYLHDTINEDIIDFKEHIENSRQQIQLAIENLNSNLRSITYQQNPDTYLQLVANPSGDQRIREFRNRLKNAIPDQIKLKSNLESERSEYEEKIFNQIRSFLNSLQANQNVREFVLDIRNWFNFAATENYSENDVEKQFYNDSASLSGGEKAKLTYTILASAIAYQFALDKKDSGSFRFVIIDEAFSKSDAANSEYAMKLFKQLDLQVMVVTPLDKINIVEDYISSIHMTENKNTDDSRLISMTIEKYKEQSEKTEEKTSKGEN